jgi:uncharacterized protein YlxW (UPF0749 family)
MTMDQSLSFGSFILGLLIVFVVNSIALYLIALSFRKKLRELQAQIKSFEKETNLISSTTLNMGQRLLALEKSVAAQPVEPPPVVPVVAPIPVSGYQEEFHSYNEANQLFQMGMSVDEVVERCGISRAEASLLEAVSRHQDVNRC